MRAIVADQLGPPQDFAIRDCAEPEPGPGQVRIAIAFAGLTFVDAMVAAGRYQVRPPVPFVPGSEFSGVIDAVGSGVDARRVGEAVFAIAQGGVFADKVVVPDVDAYSVLDALTLDQAAVFPASYMTAYYALAVRGVLKPGETVVVLGAGGAVGYAAVQVAKAMGARVIASASTADKRDLALAGGADAAIDARAADWREQLKAANDGRPVDVVFDTVSGDATEAAFRSLAWNGRHLMVGFASGGIARLPVNLPLLKGAALVGVDFRQATERDPSLARAVVASLVALVDKGALTPAIAHVYDFADFAQGMDAAAAGSSAGRLILRIAPPAA